MAHLESLPADAVATQWSAFAFGLYQTGPYFSKTMPNYHRLTKSCSRLHDEHVLSHSSRDAENRRRYRTIAESIQELSYPRPFLRAGFDHGNQPDARLHCLSEGQDW